MTDLLCFYYSIHSFLTHSKFSTIVYKGYILTEWPLAYSYRAAAEQDQ